MGLNTGFGWPYCDLEALLVTGNYLRAVTGAFYLHGHNNVQGTTITAQCQTFCPVIRAALAERELELVGLRRQLAAFEGRYLRLVGVLYAELDES